MAIRWRSPAAVCGCILFAIAYLPAQRLDYERSVQGLFADNDPALRDYEELREAFGGNAVALLVYSDDQLMTPEGLARNAELAARVTALAGVRSVLTPARLNQALKAIRPGISVGASDTVPPLLRQDDPLTRQFERLFAGYTHAPDGRSGAVVVMLSPAYSRQTLVELKQIAATLPAPLPPGSVVGEPVLIHDGFDLIERDGRTLATWTVALLSVVLLISVRDLRFLILAVMVIVWANTVTRATMVWAGIQLSLVSTMLVAIIAVIAVAAVLHLGVRWRSAGRRGHSPAAATSWTLFALAAPIVWTCTTDAAGFAALWRSQIVPVQQFGAMIAVAATAVLLAIGLFAPLMLSVPVMSLPGLRGRMKPAGVLSRGLGLAAVDRTIRRAALRLAKASIRWRSGLLTLVGLVSALAVWGTMQLQTDTSFLNNFRPDSELVGAYRQVEKHFGGAGVWDVILDAPPTTTASFLDQVRALEQDLRELDVNGTRLTKVLSIADVEAIAAQSPLLALAPPTLRLAGMKVAMPVFSDALLSADSDDQPPRLRLMLRSVEQLPTEQKQALIDQVARVVTERTTSPEWLAMFESEAGTASAPRPGRVTGYYVLMASIVGRLVDDQWRCLFVAVIAVWVLLILATRSIRLATAALLPNLVPIFLVLAVVGLLGGTLNLGAAMIAAVSIGLTIDGSVHFLAAYRQQRWRGHAREVAATVAAGRVGLPIILATVALVIGFSVLATSEFVPTATFGILVASTLTVGTIINLTVLPAAVVWLDR